MNAAPIDRVFGRDRLKMVTGAHVEVFREAAAPGESRRYTKRFLTTSEGDYAQWTEREWRILARLIGHGTRCVPDVVQYDRGAHGTKLVQTYDAGATVDQWATLLPVERDGRAYAHVFEDCAHWWALAHQCLVALDEIHSIELVHLDVKGDNICIPVGPADFDPLVPSRRLYPVFHKLALIDFAFSLVSGESLASALPIGWQQDYDYQSPRLLHALEAGRAGDLEPTQSLDWRCDMYSLAAMLKRYLPREDRLSGTDVACGWTAQRYHAAKTLILEIRETHDAPLTGRRPHGELIAKTSAQLGESDVAESLERGWTLAREAQPLAVPALPLTPITRLAPTQVTLVIPPREDAVAARRSGRLHAVDASQARSVSRLGAWIGAAAAVAAVVAISVAAVSTDALDRLAPFVQAAHDKALAMRDAARPDAPSPPAVPTERENPPADESSTARASSPAPSDTHASAAAEPPPEKSEPARTVTPQSMPSAPSAAAPSHAGSTSERAARTARPRARVEPPRVAPPPVAPKPNVDPVPAPRIAEPPRRAQIAQPNVRKRSPSAVVARYEASLAALRTTPVAAAPVGAPSSQTAIAAATPATPTVLAPPSQPAVAAATASTLSIPAAPRAETQPIAQPPATVVVQAAPEPPKPTPVPAAEPPRPATQPASVAAPGAPPSELAPLKAPPERNGDDEYLARARLILSTMLPRASEQARAQIARVLWLAAGASRQADEPLVVEAVARSERNDPTLFSREWAPADARRLHEAARRAYWSRGQLAEALDLELRAFGANPNDADIASELALLYLRVVPAEPERARQLSLHAIRLSSGRPTSAARVEPWLTFAIASALAGRVADATQALYVSVALAPSVERVCRAAQGAASAYGERVREPIEAAFYRLRMQGRDEASPYCAWPASRGPRYR